MAVQAAGMAVLAAVVAARDAAMGIAASAGEAGGSRCSGDDARPATNAAAEGHSL
jgi:hypothetical protein